ncbi:MAG: hypothetical protein ACTSUV_02425 [Candidatus Ranarchaeia archaeon]
MSWKVWKKAGKRLVEEYDKAVSYRNRGELKESIEHFFKAYELSAETKEPEQQMLGLKAYALGNLYQSVLNRAPDMFSKTIDALGKLKPETVLELPYKIKVRDVVQELGLLIKEYQLPKIELNFVYDGDLEELSKSYDSLASDYLSLGREKILIGDLFKVEETALKSSFRFSGFSKYLLGRRWEMIDPNKSVEYYAEALGYFSQVGEKGFIGYIDDKSKKLSSVAKCYFCGRDIQGEDVHYVKLDSMITPYLAQKSSKDNPATVDGRKIIACRGCQGAVQVVAEKIGKHYYDLSLRAISEVQEEMQRQINSLRNYVRSLSFR